MTRLGNDICACIRWRWLAMVLPLLSHVPAFAETVVVYYENRPPFMQIENHQLAGSEGSIAGVVFQASHINIELVEAPVIRQVALVGANTLPACAVGLYMTDERKKLGKYTEPIYYSQPQDVVVRSDDVRMRRFGSLASLLADSSIRLVLRNGYSYGSAMDGLLKSAAATVLRLPEDSGSRIKLVLSGSADAALFTADEARLLMTQMGPEASMLLLRHFDDSPPGQPRHIFCSKMVDDAIIHRINDVLLANRSVAR